jgi:hypothetical protein
MTRRDRLLILLAMVGALLLYPSLQVAPVFWVHDRLYAVMVANAEDGASFSDLLRQSARQIAAAPPFWCDPAKRSEGEPLLRIAEDVFANESARRARTNISRFYNQTWRVARFDPPLLRRGIGVDRAFTGLFEGWDDIRFQRMRPLCKEQIALARAGEPLQPPIDVSAVVSEVFVSGADRLDQALAAYAAVRPWLSLIVYSWIAFEIVAIALLARGARRALRVRRSEENG